MSETVQNRENNLQQTLAESYLGSLRDYLSGGGEDCLPIVAPVQSVVDQAVSDQPW